MASEDRVLKVLIAALLVGGRTSSWLFANKVGSDRGCSVQRQESEEGRRKQTWPLGWKAVSRLLRKILLPAS